MKKLISILVVFILIAGSAYAAPIIRYDGKFSVSGADAFSLAAYGDYCYVSSRNAGLQIFNVSDIENISNISVDNPDLKAAMPTDGAENVAVYNNYLYAAFNSGIVKFSLDDPANPTKIAEDKSRGSAMDFDFYGDMMFVIQGNNLHIMDISGENLIYKRAIGVNDNELGRGRGIYVYKDKLYVGCQKGFRIFDIPSDNPDDVIEISKGLLEGATDTQFICANDDAVFYPFRTGQKLFVIDKRGVSDLSQITEDNVTVIDNISGGVQIRSCGLYGNLLILGTGREVRVFDVTEPTDPTFVSSVSTGDTVGQSLMGDVDFLAMRGAGIMALDLSEFTYLTVRDEYTSLPQGLYGLIRNAEDYKIYIDGETVYAGTAVDRKINNKIYNLSSGTHKIGYSYGDNAPEYYTTTANTSKPLSVSALDNRESVLSESSSLSELSRILIENNTDEPVDATLICAFYKDGKMRYSHYPVSINPNAGTVEDISAEIPEDVSTLDTFKAFVLKSYDNPILISDCAMLGSETVSKAKNSSPVKNGLNADISKVDYNTNSVSITLRKSGYLMPQTAVISVKPGGSGFDDLDYADVMDLSDGEASVTYFFDTSFESVPFSVKTADCGFVTEKIESNQTFVYLGPSAIEAILNTLASSGGGAATNACLKDNSNLFGIDMSDESDYASLGEQYRAEIQKAMAAKFATVTDVKTEFNKRVETALLLTRINNSAREKLDEIIADSDNQKLLNMNAIYNAMTDEGKKNALDSLFEKITSGELMYGGPDFSKYFNSSCALITLNTTGYLKYGDALKLLNAEINAGFDLDGDYRKLNDTEDELIYVHKTMERTEFTSVENAVSVFDEAVKKAINSRSTSGSGGKKSSGGGGSVGGGSISGSITVPADKDTIDTTPITDDGKTKFFDLGSDHWAYEAVTDLNEKGIISGYPDGTFRPDSFVTRSEFSKLLSVFVDTETDFNENAFDDVSENDWYYKYVMSLKKAGIINGTSETHFGVGDNLTREDMAVIITRTAEYKNISLPENTAPVLIDFTDTSEYARHGVRKVSMAGIMVGDEQQMFRPKDYVTRTMAAKVIYELMTVRGAQQ